MIVTQCAFGCVATEPGLQAGFTLFFCGPVLQRTAMNLILVIRKFRNDVPHHRDAGSHVMVPRQGSNALHALELGRKRRRKSSILGEFSLFTALSPRGIGLAMQ